MRSSAPQTEQAQVSAGRRRLHNWLDGLAGDRHWCRARQGELSSLNLQQPDERRQPHEGLDFEEIGDYIGHSSAYMRRRRGPEPGTGVSNGCHSNERLLKRHEQR